jgi:3-deoxy-D-manno-octulosonate 8-phosphate phosphatase (KDO 8-P phosphatase)
VLDLPIAEVCGIRILVNQKANPLFVNYCIKNNLVDYLTANSGGQFAIREAAELLIGLNENYDAVMKSRTDFDETYKKYISLRKQTNTEFFTLKENGIEQT